LVLGPDKPIPLALSVDDYESALQMESVWDLCLRTTCVIDAEVEKCTTSESVSGRVTVHMHDGSNQEYFVISPKGCPQNPMTTDEVAARFLALSAKMLGETECKAWLQQAYRVEGLKDLRPLFALRK
jgi:2-methylcitrate dehydratase PrpD